jgi:hypothetical protein
LIYVFVAVAAMVPPVLTFPSPAYSLGIAMGIMASPIFFLGSLADGSRNVPLFSISRTRQLLGLIGVLIAVGTAVFAGLAVEARASNDRFLWSLVGEPDTLLASIPTDSWRVDRHFNHSLTAAQRKAVATKVRLGKGEITDTPLGSVQHFPNAPLRIVNVTRLAGQVVVFVESNIDLDYGIFLLQPQGSDRIFYRKVLNWSPAQTYALIFNTGSSSSQFQVFTLALKEGTATFTTEPNTPVAKIVFSSSNSDFNNIVPGDDLTQKSR